MKIIEAEYERLKKQQKRVEENYASQGGGGEAFMGEFHFQKKLQEIEDDIQSAEMHKYESEKKIK